MNVKSALGSIPEEQLCPGTLPARHAVAGDHSGSRSPVNSD